MFSCGKQHSKGDRRLAGHCGKPLLGYTLRRDRPMSIASATAKSVEPLRLRSRSSVAVHYALPSILLVLITFAVYWPVRAHPFMPLDDMFYVVSNAHVHDGLSWPTVKWAFTAMDMINWIPITWLAHATDYGLFGPNPAGHHLVNVLLHGLAAILLFWTLSVATGFPGRSFMVAALFALHPINVEAVAWIAELKTMLSMIFFVLALAAYRWYALKPGLARYLLVASLYCVGLMAKSQIIMLPFVLLLWDYWPLQRMVASDSKVVAATNLLAPLPARNFGWLVREKVPLLLLGLADAAITMHVQGDARPKYWDYTLYVRTTNAVVAYVRYIGKALWPTSLSICYPHPGYLPLWEVLGAAVLLIAVSVLAFSAGSKRYLLVGWYWFLIMLVPTIGIVYFTDEVMADRYAYQAFCALLLVICWSAAEGAQRRHVPAALLAGLSFAVLVVLAVLSNHQLGYWRDNLVLWSHGIEVGADTAQAEDVVAGSLLGKGRTAEAMQHYARAVTLSPGDAYANLQLAFYNHQHGEFRLALIYYQAFLGSHFAKPGDKRQALTNMGHLYARLGDAERARRCFEEAAKIPAPT